MIKQDRFFSCSHLTHKKVFLDENILLLWIDITPIRRHLAHHHSRCFYLLPTITRCFYLLPTITRVVFICFPPLFLSDVEIFLFKLKELYMVFFSNETLPSATLCAELISFSLLFRLILCPLSYLGVNNWWYFWLVWHWV